ncbi:type I secretion system ATPase [Halorhodospira halochloris]|uniref:Type I secretion system ATPase n=1 Tax=Halorhodospira halochloris TaxID=1052 RepID=A0A0X8X9T1_HALHR|nr:hypothetical protein [Halorhodospira halochloris]MBK1652976.1 hypothetical protein [Halorhodospira halochloris]BAU58109.1 type I secretion system ATPase [Halorhodospira halochloris]
MANPQSIQGAGAKAKGELRECLGQFKQSIIAVAAFSFFINLLMLVPPLFMLQMFDRVLSSGSVETLVMLLIVAVGLLIVLGLLEFSRNRVLVRAGGRLDQMLSSRLFDATFLRALRRPDSATAQPLQDLTTLRQFMTGQGVFAFFDAPCSYVLKPHLDTAHGLALIAVPHWLRANGVSFGCDIEFMTRYEAPGSYLG